MSEFKYACPVCGQHIRCDSSQSGTVMDCPTCFQKIVVPQFASTDPSKLVYTAQRYVEKKPEPEPPPPAPDKPVSLAPPLIGLAVLLLVAAVAVVFVFRPASAPPATGGSPAPVNQGTNGSAVAKPKPVPKPVPELVAPPANDTNWGLNLAKVTVPAAPVVGRLRGRDFIAGRVAFQNGTLVVRAELRGALESGVIISFPGTQPEALSGHTINVTTNVAKAARVTVRWKDDSGLQKTDYEAGYALRLEFGQLANNRLPGKIYLCLPDEEKSYLMGTFNADARKPKPKN